MIKKKVSILESSFIFIGVNIENELDTKKIKIDDNSVKLHCRIPALAVMFISFRNTDFNICFNKSLFTHVLLV